MIVIISRICLLVENILTINTLTAEGMKWVLNSWILVLSTYASMTWTLSGANVPMIIDGNGKSKVIEFSYEPASPYPSKGNGVRNSCSVVWRGAMYVFGGSFKERQISKVEKCKLTRLPRDLNFVMRRGACAQRDNNKIFICFEDSRDTKTFKNCRQSDGPQETFSRLKTSTYDHGSTSIAVTSGKPLKLLNLVRK